MRDRNISNATEDKYTKVERTTSLGWLKLYIVGTDSPPASRTVYISKNNQIFAVLHTDTTGGTKAVNLPADRVTGSDYICTLDNGDTSMIRVYPYVVNVHYIDKTKEKE